MRNLRVMRLPYFENEGGGAGGGGGAGEGGGEGGGDGGTPEWTPPDFVPENFRGTTAEETLQKLSTGYTEADTRANGLRDKLAKLPAAPKAPEDYTFQPSEKLAPFFGDENDAGLKQARIAMHKHGVSQAQFEGLIKDIYEPLIDSGHMAAPYSPKAETENFLKLSGLDAQAGAARLNEVADFAEGLAGQLKDVPEDIAEDVKATLISLTDSAAGNFLLSALNGRLQENGIRVSGDGNQGGALTEDELKKMASDPRIDPANRNHSDPNKRFDPALRERYDDGHKRLAAGRKQAAF